MFAELLEGNEIKNLFLNDYQMVVDSAVFPIRGRGKNYLAVRYAQPSCGESEFFFLYISDCEVRRPKNNEPYELSCVDKVSTNILREYFIENYGKKYTSVLTEFETPIQSGLIL